MRSGEERVRTLITGLNLLLPILLVDLVGALTPLQSARAAQQYFDLGGPCSPVVYPHPSLEIVRAKKGGLWDRVIELEKRSVREGCDIEYRWRELANALVEVGRRTDALLVLTDMDSRGFDLRPSVIGREHEELKAFMETPLFKASALGMRLEELKRISDQRRAHYREVLQKLPRAQRPPEQYIAKGACPFECCRYGKWTVLQDTELVAAPGSTQVVGRAKKGTHVVGVTGEVHLKPEPVVVLKDGELPKDSIAFVLDYAGEGEGNVYTQGKIVGAFVAGVAEYCFRVSEQCWGETLDPGSERKEPVWWVKVKLPNGVTGWTNKPDNFGDKDGCG